MGTDQLVSSSPVRCCLNEVTQEHIWVESWRPEGDCLKEARCERFCQRPEDCPEGHECSPVSDKDLSSTLYKCVESRCTKPYMGENGKHLEFPHGGLEIGDSGFFHCDPNYAMAPVDDSIMYRKEVRVFCQTVFDAESGIRVEYRLQTGAKIPPCEFNRCENSNDCQPGKFCKEGRCSHKVCPSSTFKANSFIQGDREHKVGATDYVRCETGHVMKQNGQCHRLLPVTCKPRADLHPPQWVLSAEINKPPEHCIRGCTSDDDCGGLHPSCDPLTCRCVTKVCSDTKKHNGFVQVDSNALPRRTATFVCRHGFSFQDRSSTIHKNSTPVVCFDLNPQPEWRLPNGDVLPECKEDQTQPPGTFRGCETDKDCAPLHQCVFGSCSARECSAPENQNSVDYLTPKIPLTVGTIIQAQCKPGQIFGPGMKVVNLVCRINGAGDGEFVTLDGSQKASCFSGCLDSSDCPESQICVDEICESLSCQPPLISNGKLVPMTSSMVNAAASVICDTGYLLENGLKSGDAICQVVGDFTNDRQAEWRMSNGEGIPACLPGCKTRLDCPVGKSCIGNTCQWDECQKQLPASYNGILTNLPEQVGHLSKGLYVCEEGYEMEGLGWSSAEVLCFAYGETPKWRLPNGGKLPKCQKPCTEDKDCVTEKDTFCDADRRHCLPTYCSERIDRANGHPEFPGGSENRTRPLGAVGSFICDSGFILDPAMMKGEIARQVTIRCVHNLLCGGNDWKLEDGSDLPECLPGCRNTEDCFSDQVCNHDHVCVDVVCPIPSLHGAMFQLTSDPSKLGSSGILVCSRGYIYKLSRERPPKKHVNVFCKPVEGKTRKGIIVDQYGKPVTDCVRGCQIDGDCDSEDTCINNQCRPKYTCPMEPLKNLNAHLVVSKENFRVSSHVGSRGTLVCNTDGEKAKINQEVVCTPKGWQRPDGLPIMGCYECASDADCHQPKPKCNTIHGHCVQCTADADCPSEGVCQDSRCHPPCKTDADCAKTSKRSLDKCDANTGYCHECLSDMDCYRDDYGKICSVLRVCVSACRRDQDCPGKLWCNVNRGRCEWPCKTDDDCPDKQRCKTHEGTCMIADDSSKVCLLPDQRVFHGAIQDRDNVTQHGNFAHFVCDEGFAIPGVSKSKIGVLCTDHGWRQVPTYEKLPLCKEKLTRCNVSKDCPEKETCIFGQCFKNVPCQLPSVDDVTSSFKYTGGTIGIPGTSAVFTCKTGYTLSTDLKDIKDMAFAADPKVVSPSSSNPGWFQLLDRPEAVSPQASLNLVVPIATKSQSVTLYCMGGDWLMYNRKPMPKCEPQHSNDCKTENGITVQHGGSFMKSKCEMCACNLGEIVCSRLPGCY